MFRFLSDSSLRNTKGEYKEHKGNHLGKDVVAKKIPKVHVMGPYWGHQQKKMGQVSWNYLRICPCRTYSMTGRRNHTSVF